MSEARRQNALTAMGVVSYVPRFILPGARASAPLPAEDVAALTADTPVTVDASVNVSGQRPRAPSASAIAALFDNDQNNDQPQPAPSRAAAVSPATTSRPRAAGHIALTLVTTDELLLVDSAMPSADETGHYTELLRNVLRAFGLSAPSQLYKPFIWPPARTSAIDLGLDSARQTLHAHLSRQLQERGAKALVLLGEQAWSLCLSEAVPVGRIDHKTGWPVPVLCLPALRPMLMQPALKAAFWQQGQALRELRVPQELVERS